jgi:hypothetical protein
MKSLCCPHCGLRVESEKSAAAMVCPRCFRPFALPRSNQWTLLVVPILSILHYVTYVL